ncbi:Panacea domain-containing protein [Rhodococcus opacus]|uniref:Panacea domain-containing protein n=1 Tax=Rhodococcus opacus TaxID=37919 RepID=UPI00247672D1|nr:type II toxin-antitoxin system antitoxin SocA domain-containing protein [Rhodococcus opacus]MDH6290870.1 putative phage-associated protein [Rhodococcus opacus]
MGEVYRAIEIAKWFVAWAENIDAEVSNLKIQKLLYYAHGNYLAKTGEPLFHDGIQAWAHGPVVPTVYHEFKTFGSNPIDPDVALDDSFNWDDFQDVEPFLLGIWDRYGSLAAWALRERTHREAPWKESFDEDSWNNAITDRQLRDFFSAEYAKG